MEAKTFDIISRISEEHSHKTFGYLDENDLKNEIWLICLEKVRDYQPERGELENFLRVSVKNRLVNKFKDMTKSVRSPCPRCPFFKPNEVPGDCAKFFENKHECNKWVNYSLSVQSRNSLLTVSEQQTERHSGHDFVDQISAKEMNSKIYDSVNRVYQKDLDQLISSGKISKQRLHKLRREVSKSLESPVQLTIKGKNAKTKKRRASSRVSKKVHSDGNGRRDRKR
jgi:hypothetical protein